MAKKKQSASKTKKAVRKIAARKIDRTPRKAASPFGLSIQGGRPAIVRVSREDMLREYNGVPPEAIAEDWG